MTSYLKFENMNCKSGLIEILAWINFLHLHISHYKFLWKRFGIKDLDCVAEEKVEFSWVLGWFIRCYLKSFLYSRNYPFKGLYEKKKQNRKELRYRKTLGFHREWKSLYLQKSFLFIQKALNLKVITGNYSVYICCQ